MAVSVFSSVPEGNVAQFPVPHEAHSSGVSWAAVIGGAFVTAALSLILLALGAGLGLSSVSPWSNIGASASTIGIAAVVWLLAMQLIASTMGGYLAGRLRVRWSRIHDDEVFFRDTAHGFLSWSLATVLTAAFLASAAASIVGSAAQAASGPAAIQANDGYDAYYVDTLFRTNHPGAIPIDAAVRAEAGRIFAISMVSNGASSADTTYLAQVVAAKTGLSQPEAEKRVSDLTAQSRQAIDTARKTAAHVSLWIFIALLVGAFSASCAATIGGRQRDHVVVV